MLTGLKRLNIFLIIISILIIFVCFVYNAIAYSFISNLEFNRIISTRIIGTDVNDIFVEIVWEVQNDSISSYNLSINEAYLFELGERVGNIYFDPISTIKGNSGTRLSIRADIPREIFERLMTNHIDSYTFHMIADATGWILFFPKNIRINQHLPIDIRLLINHFLSESLRNFLSVESAGIISERNANYLLCNISVYNRCQMDLFFREFEGTVEIDREFTGVLAGFEPIRFAANETVKNTNMRFRIDRNFIPNDTAGFILNGAFKVALWGRVYVVPIELMGEV